MYSYDLFEKIFGKPVSLFGLDLHIYLYGLFIAIGILLAILVLYKFTSKKNMSVDIQDFCFFSGIFAIALGFLFAKIFQAFYDYIETGKWNFADAGITAMGGFIGGAITFIAVYFGIGAFYFKGKKKGLHLKEFNKLLIVAPCCITIAHAFGRIGCLMAGCCHGKYLGTEYVFGGVWMYNSNLKAGFYVPTQLYESLFLFILFVALSILYFKKCNITMQIYLIAYGVWRFLIEFARTDERGGFVLGLSPSQWQSFIFIGMGLILLLIYYLMKIPFWNDYETVKTNRKKEK